MRYRDFVALGLLPVLLGLMYLSIGLDPIRTAVAGFLLYAGYRLLHSRHGDAMVGVVHHLNRQYPLEGLVISSAIIDAKLDLSRAIIPEGEQTISIRGLVGDVVIYLPDDLDVGLTAVVGVGALNVMGAAQRGFGRRSTLRTKGYDEAPRKVQIEIALVTGDVDVRPT